MEHIQQFSMEHIRPTTNLDPLPPDIRNGMIAMGIFGVLSTVSTFSLMAIITHRMIYWRRYFDQPIATNQIFVLIYNLLLADFQQALSFVISFHWLAQNKLVDSSPACFAQGWLVQIGDVASGLWVLAIAVHTFINIVGRRAVKYRTFVIAVVLVWMFSLFLTVIGPVKSKDEFFVPAGAWCWMNETHRMERLYLHYIWIFISQLGSFVIYISIFFFLLRNSFAVSSKKSQEPAVLTLTSPTDSRTSPFKESPTTTTTIMSTGREQFLASRTRILKIASYMVVYPFAYVFLTLPLATARIASMVGRPPPLVFFPVFGALMASCGFIDVILYLTTRKALIHSSVGPKHQSSSSNSPPRAQNSESRSALRAQSLWLGDMEDGAGRDVESVLSATTNGEPMDGAIFVSRSVVTRSHVAYLDKDLPSTPGTLPPRPDSVQSTLVASKDATVSHGSQKWSR
ncbi:uncharacterized protein L3040_005269 [Drepanopeziza brunnea f. sp. 'multigermtubi']|uniref:Integral membrane protein n=1 Tax=Marssonina brunnea f. sp. multigermtubi (strain MB_m1) TaxID=1072389 RepID=K1W6S1_MARBU|nr:uncharacterized protein MBM_09254 [Drepanopeziza brunnea f. sp. 'multigermtubi' MB_m1]EKD12685.1 integral membrane protein [Drepanopeziza brunnea f. sp. 'multigermtubi' MB_m1]KAJ5041699.1 hypothetical protein L3040_005269 [Drepanopeziza brunnea f. sp. 'multigermtubi']